MSTNGLPDVRSVSWIEPFFDIAFAAAVGQVGRTLSGSWGAEPFLRVFFLQALLWWTWLGYLHYVTRFDPDAARARTLTLLQVAASVFLVANADDRLDSVSMAGGVAAYATMRLLLAAQFLSGGPAPAGHDAQAWARGLVPAAALWLVSAMVEVPWRFAMWGAAALLEIRVERSGWRLSAASPPDPRHLPERFGLFTLILLGEVLVAVMRGVQQQPVWHWRPLSAAVASLVGDCLVWWAYFVRLEAASARPLVTRDDLIGEVMWTYAHLPLFLGLALGAVVTEAAIRDALRTTLDARHTTLLVVALAATACGLLGLSRAKRRAPARQFEI